MFQSSHGGTLTCHLAQDLMIQVQIPKRDIIFLFYFGFEFLLLFLFRPILGTRYLLRLLRRVFSQVTPSQVTPSQTPLIILPSTHKQNTPHPCPLGPLLPSDLHSHHISPISLALLVRQRSPQSRPP